ncbi:MAG: ACP S-malonyltransferase [Spirochaetaceae bacterium]|nr:ACP S-malonyltransferase [Spirochaetaceae bacterium]
MRTCFLFPAQGAQYPGMARDLWDHSQAVKELFQIASDATGTDLRRLLFDGTEEELRATDRTQIAVTLANLSAAIVLGEHGVTGDGFAGFSLGEYSALHLAGVIGAADIFPIARERGIAMEAASRASDTADGRSGMAAVIGLAPERVEAAIADLPPGTVFVANYSSPRQVVLSGTAGGLRDAEAACKEAGARRFITLKVSGPFHSPLIRDAADRLAEVLADVPFADPVRPVYANVTGAQVTSGSQARELCVQQVVSSVRWTDEVASLQAAGYARYLEVGPGQVLAGLFRGFPGKVRCEAAGTLEAIEAAAAASS